MSIKQIAHSKRLARGQGMTEYIIIVALIAVAAIGVYSMFGDTVKKQTGAMAAALAGNNEKAVEWDGKSKEMIDANEKKVTNNKDLADFAHDNQLKK